MSQSTDVPLLGRSRPGRHVIGDLFVRLLREKPLGVVGAAIILALLVCGSLAGLLAPYGMTEIDLEDRMNTPSLKHLLGADHLGRDILSRIIYGARVSLIVGLSGTAIQILVSTGIGIPSGYFGGKLDMALQRLVDAWMSLPGLLVLLTVMSMVGRGTLQLILVLGILIGIGSSRIVRSAVIAIKQNDYFLAAEAIGSPTRATLVRHIIPNIMATVIIIFSISIGDMIMSEAALSFLGFGLPPEVPSWGGMLSSEGRTYMEVKPSLALLPGLALATVIYGVNMFGDAMRDLLDPRLRGAGN